MRWENKRRSSNIEDRRSGGRRGLAGGGGIGLGAIVIALVAWGVFGINPLTTLGLLSDTGTATTQQVPASQPPADDRNAAFVATVLASTEDVWSALFQDAGNSYPAPRLVLYRDATPTACGMGQSAMGPFYCPGDQKIYLDMDFFDTYAGVWARRSDEANQWLDADDMEAAINAAQQIGDDTLQKRSQGRVVPDSFTHGTSAQRVRWFSRGHEKGNPNACDTFGTSSL